MKRPPESEQRVLPLDHVLTLVPFGSPFLRHEQQAIALFENYVGVSPKLGNKQPTSAFK